MGRFPFLGEEEWKKIFGNGRSLFFSMVWNFKVSDFPRNILSIAVMAVNSYNNTHSSTPYPVPVSQFSMPLCLCRFAPPAVRPHDVVTVEVDLWACGGTIAFAVNQAPRGPVGQAFAWGGGKGSEWGSASNRSNRPGSPSPPSVLVNPSICIQSSRFGKWHQKAI